MIGKSIRLSNNNLKMFLKLKRSMDPGGWVLLILCSSFREFVLEKYSLNLGKCTQLKDNGRVKQTVGDVLLT